MSALYLTHDELVEQTGLIQGAAQIRALKADGFIAPDGSFDETKLNDLATISALIASVQAVLTAHGVAIPPKVQAVIAAKAGGVLPLFQLDPTL